MKKIPMDNRPRLEDALLRWDNEGGKRAGGEIENALQAEVLRDVKFCTERHRAQKQPGLSQV
jgi:hypothetical protein